MHIVRPKFVSRHLFALASICALLLAGGALAQDAEPAAAPEKPDIRARLETMMKQLEEQRIAQHIVGMSIAVVSNDEVILCEGLGEANLENHTKVTGDTIFAIGSSTKAFTTTAIGILVDEGKMDWDANVHEYLPDFHLHDPQAEQHMTLRDLASHRSGLSRMGMLWASGKLTRDEILDAVVNAEPMYEFRKKFNYSNINFIAAGDAAGKAFGSDWETLVRAKLLVPLEMEDSTLSISSVLDNPRLAAGYRWDDIDERNVVDPMRNLDSAAPAGSINSTARDMAKWLRFQLAHGVYNGTRLISDEQIELTHTPQIEMGGGVSYGLGWMIGEYEGQPLIQHGGNIDGFSAMVSFLPEQQLGFVLLINTGFVPLQNMSHGVIYGALLGGDDASDDGAGDKEDFSPYFGKYIANFGPFHDARFTVQVKDGKLAVDVPGQMLYDLKAPNEEGKREFAMTNQIAVDFVRDDDGKVTMLRMFQGGLTFECPREGVEIKPEVALGEVREYLGTYHFEEQNKDCEVLMQNGRLAIDVPGQMVYELRAPNDEDKWVFRATDGIAIRFNHADDGDVESLTMFQAGREFTLPRTGDPESAMTATLDDVLQQMMKAYGTTNLTKIRTLRATGTTNFVNQGVTAANVMAMQGLDHYRNDIDLGRSGFVRTVVAGDRAWTVSSFDPLEEIKGKYLHAALKQSLLGIAADWREMSDEISLEGVKPIDGRPHYVIHTALNDVFTSKSFVDVETGLATREELMVTVPLIGMMPMQIEYGDYRSVEGVMLPFKVTVHNDMQGDVVTQYDTMEANIDLPADTFAEPVETTETRPTTRSAR